MLRLALNYILCAVLFIVGCMAMLRNFDALFSDMEQKIDSSTTLILNESLQADTLEQFLLRTGYCDDPADAALTAKSITETIHLNGAPENLGAINRPNYKIDASRAWEQGGQQMKKRIGADYERMGMDADWTAASRSGQTSNSFGTGPAKVKVTVANSKTIPQAPLSGITVRVREHRLDSTPPPTTDSSKVHDFTPQYVTRTLGYAVTDSKGVTTFNLEPGHSYSFVPIAHGYQYGQEKGTTGTGTLPSGGLNLTFRQSPHRITPFDSYTYQAIKADRSFIVRTPQDFTNSVTAGAAIFLLGWLGFFIFLYARDRMLRTKSDYLTATLIMALTAIGTVSMYAMTSPLSDKNYGLTMATALGIGLIAMALVSCVNPAKFFAGKSRVQGGTLKFDPINNFVQQRQSTRTLSHSPRFNITTGITYLAVAVGLILLLGMFGSGPEGSDARVNLGPFQPSEVCKYLILIFVAAFFAENATLIQDFSAKITTLTARRQLSTLTVIIAVMIALMLLYLLVLSDMGPALVILVTFIFLYAMARRDFAQLLVGLISFIAVMMAARAIENTPLVMGMAALLWFAGWLAFGWFTSRRIYESAVILNLLIVVFALGGPILKAIGAESEAARLTNRTEMSWGGQWDNTVLGGDQVAQGIWSVASGGATGMGLGNGSPSVVPAFHTDMAFTSIGEMLGLTGLVLVVVCFVMLIHRCLLIGRRAGQPFTMYLVMGIALITGVQFLFIVFGSLGIVPLTGVTVPFLSYSRTSLIATMAVFGIVLSASRNRATEGQYKYARSFSGPIAASVLLFIIGALVIIGTLADYQIFSQDATMIRPAYITNTQGARVIEYNPRIGMVLDRLHAGNIYDRNGVLLATSSPDSLRSSIPRMVTLGIDKNNLLKETRKRKSRYYTMDNYMLFLLGDAGTKRVLGYQDSDPIGYMAEARHAEALRGLDIPSKKIELTAEKFRENRFMPGTHAVWTPRERDYTSVLPFLRHGIYNNPEIEAFNSRRAERDMHLTVDANLQKIMHDELTRHMKPLLKSHPQLRASVVVLNAATGDFLTSSNFPMPEQDSIVKLNDARLYGDAPYERTKGHAPITERDLGMTFQTPPGSTAKVMSALAALRGMGMKATDVGYTVTAQRGIEGAKEPLGYVTMARAIPLSSNNFFINIINDHDLYTPLGDVYEAVGVRLHDNAKENPNPNVTSYFFNQDELGNSEPFRASLSAIRSRALRQYRIIADPKRIQRTTNKDWGKFELHLPWGQEPLKATPLAMARVVSAVANDGKLVPTRYVQQIGNNHIASAQPISIVGAQEAHALQGFMRAEAMRGKANLPRHTDDPKGMGGKTGTPERSNRRGNAHCNDAWYICYLYSQKLNQFIGVALRMERTDRVNSSLAKQMMGECIIPALDTAGYQIY